MKKLNVVILSLFFCSISCFSQKTGIALRDSLRRDSISQAYWENLTDEPVDTVALINEINALTNDSLIKAYWQKLYASDQDLHFLCEPAQSAINLLKCCYFFRKFGFSNHDACTYGNIIWGHNGFNDLAYIAVPIVKKCKAALYKVFIPDSFYVKKLAPLEINYLRILSNNVVESRFDTIIRLNDFTKMVNLVNEVKALSNKFNYVNPNEISKKYILGKWGIAVLKNGEKRYQWIIFTYNNNFYLKQNRRFGFYKMIKKDKSIFNFYTIYDGSYLEILPNGNLAHKAQNGVLIEEFEKWKD